jgi:hypothetical protein
VSCALIWNWKKKSNEKMACHQTRDTEIVLAIAGFQACWCKCVDSLGPVNNYDEKIELGSEIAVSYAQIRDHKNSTEFRPPMMRIKSSMGRITFF